MCLVKISEYEDRAASGRRGPVGGGASASTSNGRMGSNPVGAEQRARTPRPRGQSKAGGLGELTGKSLRFRVPACSPQHTTRVPLGPHTL